MVGVVGKGQVTLYVVLGLAVVLALMIAVTIIREESNPADQGQDPFADDPALAAEAGRMQERVDDCLGSLVVDVLRDAERLATEPVVEDRSDMERLIATELAAQYPACFSRFNTAEKLRIIDDDEPAFRVAIADDRLLVTAEYGVEGSYEGRSYPLHHASASVASSFGDALDVALAVRRALIDPAAYGTDDGYVTKDGYFDPDARVRDGLYSELFIALDGSCRFTLIDNRAVEAGESEEPIIIPLSVERCALAENLA